MHGGKSTGRPLTHGRHTKAAIEKKREWRRILGELTRLLNELSD